MTAPLRFPRLLFHTLTSIFAVAVIALCACALVVADENAKLVAASRLPGVKLYTDDLAAASSALAAPAGVSLLAALMFTFQLLFRPNHNWTELSIPTLAFCSTYTLASSIVATSTVVRKAWITLSIDLPDSLLDQWVARFGLNLEYVDTSVAKAYVIFEWFLWLSVSSALVAEILAFRKSPSTNSETDRQEGLLKEDLKLWDDRKPKVVRIREINGMRSWIESYLSDADEVTLLPRVANFTTKNMTHSNLARQVVKVCDRLRSNGGPKRIMPMTALGNPPPSIVPRNIRKLKFLDIAPLELARQLTLLESKLFTWIEVNECLGKAWPEELVSEGTPHVKAMIDMSNFITRWVAETILAQSELNKRAKTIKHFISIAEQCRRLNNFSTLMQIVAGLNSPPILRLERTWETLSRKYISNFNQLNTIMSPAENYATYHEMNRNMTPPCVPFMGVYLTDRTFIGNGNPDNLRDKTNQISFNERQKAAELIVQIQSYQSMPYQLTLVPAISGFISDHLESQPDEQTLFNMSLDIEPRERDDEKVARLLAESGFL